MTMFDLALPRRVLFGPGRAAELAGLLPGLGRRVLMCTGRDPSRHRDLLGGADPVAVVPVSHEPTVDEVRTATGQARAAGADVVVAVRGGGREGRPLQQHAGQPGGAERGRLDRGPAEIP